MAVSLRKRLNTAENLLAVKEKEYNIILKAYKKTDAGIDESEAKELRGLVEIIKMNRDVIADAYFDKLSEIKEFDALEEPVVTVPADTYKYGEVKPFDSPDYYDIFYSSMYDWALGVKIALNSVTSAASGQSSSSQFQLNSILGVILAGFSIATVYGKVAIAVGRMIAAEMEKGIRSDYKSEPVNPDELNKVWQKTYNDYANKPKHEEFGKFISDWKTSKFKEDMRVPGDTKLEYIGTKIFNSACRSFPQESLPTNDFFQKRFLRVLLSQVQNDDFLEDDDEAGDAEIHFIIENYAMRDGSVGSALSELAGDLLGDDKAQEPFVPKFKFFHGQLDDVSTGLLNAIKVTYGKSTKIIDLPVLINISVFAPDRSTRLFIVRRSSEKIGNTNFKLSSGGGMDESLCPDFIRSKIIETVKIGDLVYDD